MRLYRVASRGTKPWFVLAANREQALLVSFDEKPGINPLYIRVVADLTDRFIENSDLAEVERQGIATLKYVKGQRKWLLLK